MVNTVFNIGIDSDGVLAHFDRKVEQITKTQIALLEKSKMWSSIGWYDANVEPFFESLDKMDDADILMDFIKANFEKYFILTAKGNTPRDAGEQKLKWYEKHYGKDLLVEVVNKSPDKARFATPTTILIDDRAKSIDPFVAAGGIGILHTSAEDTIRQLTEILAR